MSKPTYDELLEHIKSLQSRICESCQQYIDSQSEQVCDHSDECVNTQDVIESAEGKHK